MYKLRVAEPQIGHLEIEYVTRALKSGWISHKGPFVEKFEEEFANYTKAKYAILVSSGTAALQIACMAILSNEIREGRLNLKTELVRFKIPNYTFIATAVAPLLVHENTRIKLIDIEPKAWSIKTDDIQSGDISIPVAISGYLWDLNSLGGYIIADMAQGLGTIISDENNKEQGITEYCDIAIYSLFANKTITTGEGGVITTDSDKLWQLCDRLKTLPTFGDDADYSDIHFVGNNFRPTNIQAALGLAQLKQLDDILHAKGKLTTKYRHELMNLEMDIRFQDSLNPNWLPSDWMFRIAFANDHLARNIRQELEYNGIETKPLYIPLSKHPSMKIYRDRMFKDEDLNNSEHLYGFYLPTHQGVTDQHVLEITKIIKDAIRRNEMKRQVAVT